MLSEKPPTDKHTAIYHELLYIAGFCKVIPEENQTNITTLTYYYSVFHKNFNSRGHRKLTRKIKNLDG
jgi:hypothetical protein